MTDTIAVYLDDRLVCTSCWDGVTGDEVDAFALPNGFTCDECWVTINV